MGEKSERGSGGRFAAGNPGGPGNSFARKVAALRKAAADFASEDNVRTVLAAMFLRAQQGDVAAARLWLAYTLGRPGEGADPDRLDAHETQVRREAAEARREAGAPPTPPAPRGQGPAPASPQPRAMECHALPGAGEAPDPGHPDAPPAAARPSPFYRSSSGSAPSDADRPPTASTASATENDGGRHAPSPNGESGPRRVDRPPLDEATPGGITSSQ